MEILNPPEPYDWSPEEIRLEFQSVGNERKIAKIYGLSLKKTREILKQKEEKSKEEENNADQKPG